MNNATDIKLSKTCVWFAYKNMCRKTTPLLDFFLEPVLHILPNTKFTAFCIISVLFSKKCHLRDSFFFLCSNCTPAQVQNNQQLRGEWKRETFSGAWVDFHLPTMSSLKPMQNWSLQPLSLDTPNRNVLKVTHYNIFLKTKPAWRTKYLRVTLHC